ncbi:MAG TPA: hypothetical protein VIP98_14415 [Microlunatus sp.]
MMLGRSKCRLREPAARLLAAYGRFGIRGDSLARRHRRPVIIKIKIN